MTVISPPIQAVLDLFSSSLADVRFGDVDTQSLARIAMEVQAASAVMASAQVALDAARAELHGREEALLLHAQRALAYARVYAENDEALSACLEAITLPRPPRGAARARTEGDSLILSSDPQPASRPRGRPRKVIASESMLDGIASSPAE